MLGRRVGLAASIAMLAVLAIAGSAHACSCAQVAPRDALRQADAALVAELVEVLPRGGMVADYRYEVQRSYKAERRVGGTISVRSAASGAACGLPAAIGHRYGLLLRWARGRWRGSLCGAIGPRQLRRAALDLGSGSGRARSDRANCGGAGKL